MAENTKELGEAINQPLKELSFEHIIGEPLRACVDAQQEAAIATYQYLKAVGFEKDPTLLADFKPTPMVFYFEKDGNVSGVRVTKSLSAECDREVMRVLNMMPKWKPGIQNDRPCRTKVCIPVVFRL